MEAAAGLIVAGFEIRAEKPGDAEPIAATHRAVFGGELEAQLVDRLREEGELLVSLVAQSGNVVVGHIAIGPAGIVGSAHLKLGWLAPVGVRPEHQAQGLGTGLIRAALNQAHASGLDGMIVLGDPAFYRRFGFDARAATQLSSRFAGPALQFLPYSAEPVQGELIEPRAFAVFG